VRPGPATDEGRTSRGGASSFPDVGEVAGPRSMRRLLDAIRTVASDLELGGMLQRIIEAAVDLVDARYGALGVLDRTGTRLAEFLTVGVDDETRRRIGHPPEGHGILGLLIVDAVPLRLPDLTLHPDSSGFPPGHPPMTSFLGVPIRVRGEVFGNLYLTDKISGEAFTEVDEELAIGLAGAAGVAIENARLSARVRDLALIEDRERIARDLHDTVIQRLFATGMSLQSTIRLVEADPAAAARRVDQAVADLDVTIKDIRTAIFGLEQHAVSGGLRARVVAAAHAARDALGFEPRVVFDGPLDTTVGPDAAEAVVATVREALSNVARHAGASAVDVEVTVDDDVRVHVRDDGVGIPDAPGAGHGLANMAARADRLGGAFSAARATPAGTIVTWRAPRA
jgi:nitrate/nitrite-specific signal transduction histidine kinase